MKDTGSDEYRRDRSQAGSLLYQAENDPKSACVLGSVFYRAHSSHFFRDLTKWLHLQNALLYSPHEAATRYRPKARASHMNSSVSPKDACAFLELSPRGVLRSQILKLSPQPLVPLMFGLLNPCHFNGVMNSIEASGFSIPPAPVRVSTSGF